MINDTSGMPCRLKDVGKTTIDLAAAGFTRIHAKPFMHSHVSFAVPVTSLTAVTHSTWPHRLQLPVGVPVGRDTPVACAAVTRPRPRPPISQ